MDSRKVIRRVLLILGIAWGLFSLIGWISSNYIHDATVDQESGNIAILYRDHELKVYDPEGGLITTVNIDLYNDGYGGYASLEYINGILYVTMLRTDKCYKVDSTGELTLVDESLGENDLHAWNGDWKRDSTGMCCTLSMVRYKYNYPSYWKYLFGDREISFEITNLESQDTVVIWSVNK